MFISRAKIHPVCIGVKYWDILYQLLNSHSLPVPLVLVVRPGFCPELSSLPLIRHLKG